MRQKQNNPSRQKRTVEPVKDPEAMNRIRETLRNKPRDLLLFDLSTQTKLRMKELLKLKVKDLLGLKVGDRISSSGIKEDFVHPHQITEKVYQTFQQYLKEFDPKPEDFLFKSRKGQNPLNLSSVSHMIRGWLDDAGIHGSGSTRFLRKMMEYPMMIESSDHPKRAKNTEVQDSFKPIDTLTLQEKVYEELFRSIAYGKIPPGTRLTAAEISKWFNVSPMPVREALRKLETVGFLVTQKKKGTVVKKLTKEELKEITTIRLTLERLAAQLACKTRTQDTLNRLEALMEVYAHTKDPEELLRVNKEFHHTIYRDANMPLLQQIIMTLWDRVSPYLSLFVYTLENWESDRKNSLRCHLGMLEGMRRKDSKQVSEWVKADLTALPPVILDFLEHKKEMG